MADGHPETRRHDQKIALIPGAVHQPAQQSQVALHLLERPARRDGVLARPLLEPVVRLDAHLDIGELPVVLAALRQLRHPPDLILCDGQGIAHPRRMGVATHLGILTDLPTMRELTEITEQQSALDLETAEENVGEQQIITQESFEKQISQEIPEEISEDDNDS